MLSAARISAVGYTFSAHPREGGDPDRLIRELLFLEWRELIEIIVRYRGNKYLLIPVEGRYVCEV